MNLRPSLSASAFSIFAIGKYCGAFVALAMAAAVAPSAFSQEEAPTESIRAGAEELAAGATLFPIPAYGGDLMTREAMTGDWGGMRMRLAEENGVQIAADVNQFYQGVWNGGRGTGAEYNGSADYRLRIDTGQGGLWPGGFLDVHGETYWGKSVNGQTGALLPVNIDPALSAPGGPGTYLPHVVFTQFLSEKFAFILGKMDTTVGDSNRFAHGVGDQRFMNLAFSFNPVVLRNAPYSTLGAGVIWVPAKEVSLSLSVIDADGSITESGFDTIFNGNTTYSAELGVGTRFFDQPGRHTFGGTYSNREGLSVSQDPRLFVPGSEVIPSTEDESWALYYNFDQFLYSDPDDPSKGWGLFGRFGLSDGDANILHRFYSIGLGGTGIIPGRDRDRFGIGYYYLRLSDNRVGLLTEDGEQGVEVFYNMALTPWFELGLDLQVIDGAVRNAETAVVGGLRGRVLF